MIGKLLIRTYALIAVILALAVGGIAWAIVARTEPTGPVNLVPTSLYTCTNNGQTCTPVIGSTDGTLHIQ